MRYQYQAHRCPTPFCTCTGCHRIRPSPASIPHCNSSTSFNSRDTGSAFSFSCSPREHRDVLASGATPNTEPRRRAPRTTIGSGACCQTDDNITWAWEANQANGFCNATLNSTNVAQGSSTLTATSVAARHVGGQRLPAYLWGRGVLIPEAAARGREGQCSVILVSKSHLFVGRSTPEIASTIKTIRDAG